MMVSERDLLFQGAILMFHVKLQGCIWENCCCYQIRHETCARSVQWYQTGCLNLEILSLSPPGQLYSRWFCCQKMGQTWRVPFIISIHNLRLFTAGVYPACSMARDGFLKYPYPDLVSYSLKFVSTLGTNLVSRFCNIIWSIYVIGKELSDLVQRIPSPSKRNRLVKCCSPFWCKNNIMLFKYEWSLRMGLKFILASSLISLPFRKFTCF